MHRRRPFPSNPNDTDKKIPKTPMVPRKKLVEAPAFWQSILALLLLGMLYGFWIWLARICIYKGYVAPLPQNAPLDRFSEGRSMKHVWHLAHEIGGRQEGTQGLAKAAEYLKTELYALKAKSSNLRFDIDESLVSGSFNLHFLKHSMGFAYRNHTNIAARISTEDALHKPAVLVNGHFDGPLGSPGAADCASCVASMLEVLRLIIDTNWKPPAPIIFLFNGAEEIFLLGSHGFITTHEWSSSIGAAINVEASGACGPDLLVQSGPGHWPSRVYAESAKIPMANSLAQDIFPLVPGDTDYRIFSRDFSNIPGLDIVLLLNGYVYHTAYDRPENIAPGSLQARGENLMGLLRGFTSSSELRNASERIELSKHTEKNHVYFDFLGLFMVYYSREFAIILHSLPLFITLIVPVMATRLRTGSTTTRYFAIIRGVAVHGLRFLLAIVFPVVLAVIRLFLSSTAMTWFAQPSQTLIMFVPVSLAGLLLPHVLLSPTSFTYKSEEDSLIWSAHWGAVGFYALLTAAATYAGIMSGFFPFWWALFMIPALTILQAAGSYAGHNSIWSMLAYIFPALVPMAFSIFLAQVTVQFIIEKMGMVGSHPEPLGFYLADIIVAVLVGFSVGMCVAPIIPGVSKWIARRRIILLLLVFGIGMGAWYSNVFPYTVSAPKRIVVQQTFHTTGDEIMNSSYRLSTIDANSMKFVFKHAPEVFEGLSRPQLSEDTAATTFLPLYPISALLSQSFDVSVLPNTPYRGSLSLPKLIVMDRSTDSTGIETISLELDLGMLEEIWASAMNITGPLFNWSFADGKLPDPETVYGGPPSYICRLTGKSSQNENWKFWIQKNGSDPLRIQLGVLDQRLTTGLLALTNKFPSWAAVVAGSGYLSSYVL